MKKEHQKVPKGTKTRSGKSAEYSGVIALSSKGVGYVPVTGFEESIEIQPMNTDVALHGDTVRIALVPGRGRRQEGKVLEVLERSKNQFVGVLQKEGEVMVLIPDDRKMLRHIKVNSPLPKDAEVGMKVLVKMHAWKDVNEMPEGDVVQVIGKAGLHDTEMQAIIIAQGFEAGFPAQVEGQANALREGKDAFIESQIPHRRDMRKTITYTIDPADAKDFDDAISVAELTDGDVEIGIHIADVSAYVKDGDVIDIEAEHRGTSIYLVDRTIPMLPEVLSNDLCSLNPNEDKLTNSAVFIFDKNGNLKNEWFGETIINSDHRFAYEEAQKVLDDKEGPLVNELKIANRIAEKLRAERFKNGSIAFETDEVKFKLDDKGVPIGVYIKTRQATNLMIEDLMLLANRKVAEFITKGAEKVQDQAVCIYRIHDQPKPDRIEELSNFLKAIGYEIDKNHDGAIEASDINALFKEIQGTPEQGLIETAAVRSMAKAIYSTKNIGHFGLAFKFYTHFTSPIRRYPDLMVHRLLKRAIKGDFASMKELGKFDLRCAHASEREVAAVEAERDSVRYKQIEFLRPKIGQTFNGIISGVAEWGLYISEIETKAEGLLRIRDIGDDYYNLDEKNYCIRGERTKKVFSLGDKITVVLADANLGEKQITWKATPVS